MTAEPAATSAPLSGPVAVIGCGWVGWPLARALLVAGAEVRGSATTPEKVAALRAEGVAATRLRLTPDTSPESDELTELLRGAHRLVLTVPPGRGPERERYAEYLSPVAQAAALHGVRQLIFTSSTGVYPNDPHVMTESDALATPDSPSPLLRAEAALAAAGVPLTVLRFAGLYGPGRPPGRFLAGRTEVGEGERPSQPRASRRLCGCGAAYARRRFRRADLQRLRGGAPAQARLLPGSGAGAGTGSALFCAA
ncbi:NAD(P)H-binding protein [Deinococcus radiodurans]|uniref:NAD(P)H-binding protein n=1 Tax=Deinococcus radiodurans TaxID=1299 RepID=UPI002017AED5|nr:NAD(P)H-binding protein [Deinococcus radiodurans]